MQKRTFLSVKEAAEMLNLNKRTIKERLNSGELKGEKRQIGLRDKWFIYAESVQASMAAEDQAVADDVDELDEFDSEGVTEFELQDESQVMPKTAPGSWLETNRDRAKLLAEEFVRPLMDKIESQQQLIRGLEQTVADQARQLRLLPDLQKQADQHAQQIVLKHVEAEALKTQVAALEAERVQLQAGADQAERLSNELQSLRAKFQDLQRPWWKRWLTAS